MATKLIGSIDFLAIPNARIQIIMDENNKPQECVCIPIKTNNFRKYKRQLRLNLAINPLKYSVKGITHICGIAYPAAKIKKIIDAKGNTPIIGNFKIGFKFLKPVKKAETTFDDLFKNYDE